MMVLHQSMFCTKCLNQHFFIWFIFHQLKYYQNNNIEIITCTILITFADPFVDTISAGFIILSHVITELSIVLAKYLSFSQIQC